MLCGYQHTYIQTYISYSVQRNVYRCVPCQAVLSPHSPTHSGSAGAYSHHRQEMAPSWRGPESPSELDYLLHTCMPGVNMGVYMYAGDKHGGIHVCHSEYNNIISRCHVVPRCNKCDIAPFTYIFPPLGMHLVGFMLYCIFNVSDYNTM